MTYVKQLDEYEQAVMRKRLEEMPEGGALRCRGAWVCAGQCVCVECALWRLGARRDAAAGGAGVGWASGAGSRGRPGGYCRCCVLMDTPSCCCCCCCHRLLLLLGGG